MNCRTPWMFVALCVVCAAALPVVAQTEWTLDPEEPVLEPAPPGSWDHGLRFIEAVIKVDGIYHMFYRGQPDPEENLIGTYSIGHATSGDGVSWTLDPANPVLSPGADGDWDHGSIRGAAVIHDGSRFRMWYASVTQLEGYEVQWHGIGHATSTDGSLWSKSVENPIVRPGSSGTSAIPQAVIRVGGGFRMWYASSTFLTEGDRPAQSSDGLSWEGFGYTNTGWLWPAGLSVVKDGARYLKMVWQRWGYQTGSWGAASPDGWSWSNLVVNPLIFYGFSPAMLIDGDNLVMWYSEEGFSSGDPGIYRATSTCCDTTYSWFVPAAASGPGVSGSFYRTEVEINSASDVAAEYRFAWFPRDRDNSEWIRSGLYQLRPGRSMRYSDVLAEVFGLGPGSFGALAVEATSSDVHVAARISSSDGRTGGAFGQSIPVVGADWFYANTLSRQRILFGGENADERFNITCFSGGVSALWPNDVELELHDAEGRLLGTESLHLPPFGSGQVNRIFADHRPVEGYVQVRNGYGTYCFGSRIDNRTHDPTTILPR